MLATLDNDRSTMRSAVSEWLERFDAALRNPRQHTLEALFTPDGHWRDLLALTWRFRTLSGAARIASLLVEKASLEEPRGFRLAQNRTEPRRIERVGVEVVEAFFEFETRRGSGQGVVRLVPDADEPARMCAWTLMTELADLKGFEEVLDDRTPRGEENLRNFGGENWLDARTRLQRYDDREPTVLVVGAGQAGLGIAARLQQLGVDTLLIDRNKRVGDNWRNRYHALTLHNETWVNHLPYMPFPPNWPTYVPKDKLAGWFEAYAEAMELNVWTDTAFAGASYDLGEGRWTVRLRRGDDNERVVRPRHIVLATGASGIPNFPVLPGLEDFAGTVVHSSVFTDGQNWKGRKALVLGTGNSGHDVAQDLYCHGAAVTMIQRGTTHVVGMEASAHYGFPLYVEGPPIDDCDILQKSFPYPVSRQAAKITTQEIRKRDEDILAKLEAAGFGLDFGEDDTGYQMSFLRRGGGYYINVGGSDLIVEGKVGLIQYAEIDRFEAQGARLRDGSLLSAELVVLATGYKPQLEFVRQLFGDDVAARVGPVWGFDDEGEIRNMWKRTGQPGLWFAAGSLAQCRIYSKLLAMQIKAQEEALIPEWS